MCLRVLCAACMCVAAAAGALSIVEVGPKRVKLAAGAYVGTLEAPEQMAVFLYYLDVSATHLISDCLHRVQYSCRIGMISTLPATTDPGCTVAVVMIHLIVLQLPLVVLSSGPPQSARACLHMRP